MQDEVRHAVLLDQVLLGLERCDGLLEERPGHRLAGGPDHLLDVVHDVLGQPGVLVDLHHCREIGEGLDAVAPVDGELFHRR